MLEAVDEYEAEDAAVELRRNERDFDEAVIRAGFRAGYADVRNAGSDEGFSQGMRAALDAVNRERR